MVPDNTLIRLSCLPPRRSGWACFLMPGVRVLTRLRSLLAVPRQSVLSFSARVCTICVSVFPWWRASFSRHGRLSKAFVINADSYRLRASCEWNPFRLLRPRRKVAHHHAYYHRRRSLSAALPYPECPPSPICSTGMSPLRGRLSTVGGIQLVRLNTAPLTTGP